MISITSKIYVSEFSYNETSQTLELGIIREKSQKTSEIGESLISREYSKVSFDIPVWHQLDIETFMNRIPLVETTAIHLIQDPNY